MTGSSVRPRCAHGAHVGVDLQDVGAVTDAVDRFGERYLARVYTGAERHAAAAGSGTLPQGLAARFAAKEAVLKLLGSADGVDLREVEVLREPSGEPRVRLRGRAAQLARERQIGPVAVSMSHEGEHAVAVAMAVSAQPETTARTDDE